MAFRPPPIRGKRGRPRRRPDVLYADCGYDHASKLELSLKRRLAADIYRR